MKSIFEYLSHRDYIHDFYEEKKRTDSYSYRKFAKECGFASPVFLKLVIEGKSKLSRESAAKLAKVMGLVKEQRKFFHQLVLFTQAQSIDEKMVHLAEMKTLTREIKIHQLNSDQLEFYSSWHHPVVRELVGMLKNGYDTKEIAEHIIPHISEEEVASSVQLLIRLGLLKENEMGQFQPEDTIVSSDGLQVGSLVIRSTQKRLAELAGEAIETIAPEERNISGLTISLPESELGAVSAELQRCRQRIMEIAQNNRDANRVYRINLHLFPLTKRIDESQGGDQ